MHGVWLCSPVPSLAPFAGASLTELADALTSSMVVVLEKVQQREVRWLAAGKVEREMEQAHGFQSFLLLSANNARARNQSDGDPAGKWTFAGSTPR